VSKTKQVPHPVPCPRRPRRSSAGIRAPPGLFRPAGAPAGSSTRGWPPVPIPTLGPPRRRPHRPDA
jgi:hypothetical protein